MRQVKLSKRHFEFLADAFGEVLQKVGYDCGASYHGTNNPQEVIEAFARKLAETNPAFMMDRFCERALKAFEKE